MERIDAGGAGAGEKHHGGVCRTRLYVVVGRVFQQVGELLFLVGGAVFGGPLRALKELLIAQHIEERIAAEYGREQLRVLGDGGAHEEAAIGSPNDGEVPGRGVLVGDEVFGGGKPVVEDVLLVLEHGLFVPVFSVLAAAAQVGQGKPAAQGDPPGIFRAPGWGQADIESAIARHQQALGSILLEALPAGDVHWHTSAVFRLVEDLFQLVLAGVEGDFRLGKDVTFPGRGIDAVEGGGLDERFEADESIAVGGLALNAGGGADGLEGDIAGRLPRQGIGGDLRLYVLEPVDVDLAAHDGKIFNDVGPLGNDGGPHVRHDAGVGLENGAIERVVVGFHIPGVVGANGGETGVDAPHEDFKGRVGLGEVAIDDIDALGRHAAVDGDDEVAPVVGQGGIKQVNVA